MGWVWLAAFFSICYIIHLFVDIDPFRPGFNFVSSCYALKRPKPHLSTAPLQKRSCTSSTFLSMLELHLEHSLNSIAFCLARSTLRSTSTCAGPLHPTKNTPLRDGLKVGPLSKHCHASASGTFGCHERNGACSRDLPKPSVVEGRH